MGNLITSKKKIIMAMQKLENIIYEASNLSFDGTAATIINTGIYLFTQENINRDFEFIAEGIYGPINSTNTIICAKHNGNAYGFLVRTHNNTSTTYAGTISVINNQKATVIVRRQNGILSASGTGIKNPGMSFNNMVFNWPLMLGCAVDDDGNPYRYATGTIDHIIVKWL